MIRKATLADIKAIYEILKEYGDKGQLLSRPLSELYDHLRDFSVYVEEDKIIGCAALQFCWKDLAEIRSLAVRPEHFGKKIGSSLMQFVIYEAKEFGVKKLFTLTYQPEFFHKFGFTQIDRAKLPLKIWKECLLCVKFPDCDETAMMKAL